MILAAFFATCALLPYGIVARSFRDNSLRTGRLNVVDMIIEHGYPIERHVNIETADGYLLELHRIPHGINNIKNKTKVPVLIQHGLACSSIDWVIAGPGKSLAYALAEMGLDVWLGNNRNNMWGRKHVILDPDFDPKEFWDFSFHELGVYDITAMIDYILEVNGAEQLFYIGHSQGTTQFFAMLSERPEYNSKIILMTALAPVAFMSHLKNSFVHTFAKYGENVQSVSGFFGKYEFFGKSRMRNYLIADFCKETLLQKYFCNKIYFFLVGNDYHQFNTTLLPILLENIPAGSATKEFLHFAQEVKSGNFQQFDYLSPSKNIEHYGQPTPPEYDLRNVKVPVALHFGQNDLLSSVIDVKLLSSRLPNVVFFNKIDYKYFNHADFLWAIDVFDLLYNDVIAVILQYLP